MGSITSSQSSGSLELLTDTLRRAAELSEGVPGSGLVDLDGSQQSWPEVELTARTVAATLIASGVQPGDRVAILHQKSTVSFVAMHAALLCGAIAVPLDPFGSSSSVCSVLDQCDISLLIGAAPSIARLALEPVSAASYPIVVAGEAASLTEIRAGRIISWEDAKTRDHPDVRLPELSPDDPAYLIFTSGSTGVPKGIVHTHRSGMAYAITAAEKHRLTPDSRVAGIPPLHFDMSTLELYSTPLAGATAVAISEAEQRFPATLSQRLDDERITHVYAVPFLLRQLQERGAIDKRDLSTLAHIGYAGEPYSPGALGELMTALPGVAFTNFYGPAETNVVTSHDLVDLPDPDTEVPIGTLWPGCQQQLVDGELWVSAPTCMQGYWRRPDLSEGKLKSRDDGPPWYATGDLVSVDDAGVFTYAGRRDHQVKIRGVRIELEAVESVLTDAPGIEHAVVGVRIDDHGEKTLAVCVVLKTGGTDLGPIDRHLRAFASSRLPATALPSAVVVADELPTTASGKIDRTAVRGWLTGANHPHPNSPEGAKHE